MQQFIHPAGSLRQQDYDRGIPFFFCRSHMYPATRPIYSAVIPAKSFLQKSASIQHKQLVF